MSGGFVFVCEFGRKMKEWLDGVPYAHTLDLQAERAGLKRVLCEIQYSIPL